MCSKLQCKSTTSCVIAVSTGPGSSSLSGHLMTAVRAGIYVTILPGLHGNQGISHIVNTGTGSMRHPIGNSVMTMLGMAAAVSIQPVSHVHQFFSDDNLEGLRATVVNPLQVDENRVSGSVAEIHVGSAI